MSDEQSKEWLCELVCGDGFPYAAWQKEIWFRDPMNSGKWMVLPKLRTDNGPQFVARQFQQLCNQLGVIHEQVPVKTQNMNAHIESFHSILEEECYSRHEFQSFMEAYAAVTEYMGYYNKRRRHGSLQYMAPVEFHKAFITNNVSFEPFAA